MIMSGWVSFVLFIAFFKNFANCRYDNDQRYCDPELCKLYNGKDYYYENHIACGHSYEFGKDCSSDAHIIDLKPYRKQLLHGHNELRSKIARGLIKEYEPAVRMLTMSWDQELSYLAEFNVLSCQMKHDSCRNTKKYPFAGQNLHFQSSTGDLTVEKVIQNAIDKWSGELRDANMNYIKHYMENPNAQIGHFAQMIREHSRMMGCAALFNKNGRRNEIFLACNYQCTPILSKPIYHSGLAGSECESGHSMRYAGLCASKEKIYNCVN